MKLFKSFHKKCIFMKSKNLSSFYHNLKRYEIETITNSDAFLPHKPGTKNIQKRPKKYTRLLAR